MAPVSSATVHRGKAPTQQENQPVPRITTPLPGPKGRKIIEREAKYASPSLTKEYPFVASHGQGSFLWDVDDNCFLDFVTGIAVNSLGHNHPRVSAAIREQAEKLLHFCGADFYYETYGLLCEKLATLAPGSEKKRVLLSNSGAEAVECAIKLARYHTKRHHIIAFIGGFHGRTMGALSLTASKAVQRAGFNSFPGNVFHLPYPDIYRGLALDRLDELENVVFKRLLPPEDVAAIVIEPIQGEGGYLVPPPEYMQRLREICDRHGILLVADEVQTGVGRTGTMFCMEQYGVEPDIITLAKGIANGLPLGATIAKSSIMSWKEGSHASTFGGNPVACAAALVVFNELENGVLHNVREVGSFLMEGLRKLQQKHPLIGDVRGKGLMMGIELVRDRKTKEPAIEERNAAKMLAFAKGLLVIGCGTSGIRLIPPLILSKREAEIGLGILDDVLTEIE